MIIYIVLIVILILICLFIFNLFREDDYKKQESLLEQRHKFLSNFSDNANLPEGQQAIPYPVYYINVDSAENRRQFMEKQFDKYRVKATRVPAVSYKEDFSTVKFGDTAYKVVLPEAPCTDSEKVCLLSHLKAIHTAYSNGDSIALILEDDASLHLIPHWDKPLDQIIRDMPEDWEMLKLFHLEGSSYKPNSQEDVKRCAYFSNAGYLINRKGMEKILNRLVVGDTIIVKEPRLQADVMMVAITNTYELARYPYIYPYNVGEYGSILHSSHNHFHLDRANQALNTYFEKDSARLRQRL